MIKSIKKGFTTTLILSLLPVIYVCAQPVTLPLEHSMRIGFENRLVTQEKNWHPIYPMRTDIGEKLIAYPGLLIGAPGVNNKKLKALINRKLFFEDFIRVETKDFKLYINPLFDFEKGLQYSLNNTNETDRRNRETWVNTRGIGIDGSIGTQLAFHTAFYESQAVLPTWVDERTRELRVVPGQAMYKSFKSNGFDYAFAEGHVSYSPSSYFNFRFGHGKNFIGDGYRSLFLSDVAFNYPYLAINTSVWNIEYTNIYSQLQDISTSPGPWQPWHKKYTTTHYLSWNATPWLNIGFFESIVWQASDSIGQRGFDINYLNPIIFYRPVEFSLGSPDNALMGASIRVRFLKKNFFYTQLMLDEFKLEHVLKGDGWWANKHGFQLGVKSFDLFDVRNLFVRAEYNHVRPYTYAHNTPIQNYGHYNQPLAHPQGANFREFLFMTNYRYKRWKGDYKLVYTTYGKDTTGLNYGGNIYKPYYEYVTEYGNKIGQGLKTTLVMHNINMGWIVNPHTNLTIQAGLTLYHINNSEIDKKEVFLNFGLRSALFNRYYDF